MRRFQFSPPGGDYRERLWLSALVETMDEVSQPARCAEPCDSDTLKTLRAQLALPARPCFASPFSLRN